MKTSYLLACTATLALAATPAFSQTTRRDFVERCMDSFIAQNFPDSRITYEVNADDRPILPLQFLDGTYDVAVTARDTNTGRVLGSTTCAVNRNSVRLGEISATPVSAP